MIVQFLDTPERSEHDAFQRWRHRHPGAFFLAFQTKKSAKLHINGGCGHPGDASWTEREGQSSLTHKRKVCAELMRELTAWAVENGIAWTWCADCDRDRARALPDAPPTAFMFGYWGNGSATKELVEAIDAAEKWRGFGPPLWVDVRIRRSVRAVGFREDAFGRLLGRRYVWMPDLGNAAVLDGGSRIRIRNPAAAAELLDHVVARPNRRVIFFCACEYPGRCHRQDVARLLRAEAKKRRVPLDVVEWPGGDPSELEVEVARGTLRDVARGARSMPIPASMSMKEAASLPWSSRLVLRAGSERHTAFAGPARFDSHGARLPILDADGLRFIRRQ